MSTLTGAGSAREVWIVSSLSSLAPVSAALNVVTLAATTAARAATSMPVTSVPAKAPMNSILKPSTRLPVKRTLPAPTPSSDSSAAVSLSSNWALLSRDPMLTSALSLPLLRSSVPTKSTGSASNSSVLVSVLVSAW